MKAVLSSLDDDLLDMTDETLLATVTEVAWDALTFADGTRPHFSDEVIRRAQRGLR